MNNENDVPRYDPDNPSTRSLEVSYGLTNDQYDAIALQRERTLGIIRSPETGLIAIVGPCALTNNPEQIRQDGLEIQKLAIAYQGLVMTHRMPPWKPRTNPEDWHGLETTEAEAAYKIVANQAGEHANIAIEAGVYGHITRYGQLLSVAWTGGRNVHKEGMLEALAIHDPSLPLFVKNGLDGSVETALKRVRAINAMREQGVAQSALIYRGGENAQSPEAWEEAYISALERTGGKLIIDVAHGSEIAHDPKNKKSVEGQILAMEHVIELARKDLLPAGIMIEASGVESPTDPVMPLEIALDGVRRLYEIKARVEDINQDELLVA